MVMNPDSIPFPSNVPASLIVGFDPDISESQLFFVFSIIGKVSSVQVCRDLNTGRSLGYGYVNYISRDDATRAIERLNHTPLHVKLVDSSTLKKELAEGVDLMVVREITGGIYFGQPRGFGKNEKGEEIGFNTEVYATYEIDRIARVAFETARNRHGKLCSVDKANDSELVDSSTLKKELAEEVDLMVVREITGGIYFGQPRGFGKNEKGEEIGFNTDVYTTYEIDRIARVAFEIARKRCGKLCSVDIANDLEGSNWYVRNINLDVHDDELQEVFSQCGTITSVGLMRDDNGKSRGFGFIRFSTPKEAGKAVNVLHGFMLHQKPSYVAIKDNRQEELQLPYSNKLLETEKSKMLISPDPMIRKVEEDEQMLQLRRGIQHMEKPSSYTIIAAAKYVQDASHKGPGIVCCVDSKGVQLKTTSLYKEGDIRIACKCRLIGKRFYVLLAGIYHNSAKILKNFKSLGVDKRLMEYAVSAHDTIRSESLEEVSIILVGYTETEGHEIISVSTEDGLRIIETGIMAGCGVSHIPPGEVFFHENMSSNYARKQVIKAVKVAIERNPTRCGDPKVFLRIQGEEVRGPKVIKNHHLPNLIEN